MSQGSTDTETVTDTNKDTVTDTDGSQLLSKTFEIFYSATFRSDTMPREQLLQ